MIKFIGMYLLMGIIALFGTAIYMSLSLYNLSDGDDDVYFKSIDIITQMPDSYGRAMKMLKGEGKHGRQQYFVNVILNVVTFPYVVPIMLSRYPEAKEYVIENRSVKTRES